MLRYSISILALAAACAASADYGVTNLVSDGAVPAAHTDANLVNPWGLAASGTSPMWVANNGTSTSTIYKGDGTPVALVVATQDAPTGIVFSGGAGFGNNNFIFSTEGGVISGWSGGTSDAVLVDTFGAARFKGLGILGSNLYATNFTTGNVDQYNTSNTLVRSFTDPTLPAGYSAFGIQAIGSSLFVTYALKGATGDDVAGAGNGFVDEFDGSGNLLRRVVSQGALNSPWGLAMAPGNFGSLSGDLLVGNFGDGKINAFNPLTGAYVATLQVGSNDLVEEGLWALRFGNGGNAGPTNTLFFTAGVNHESNGLYGSIQAVPEPASMLALGLGVLAVIRRKRTK